MPVKHDFGSIGGIREVETFEDLKEKGILVSSIRRKIRQNGEAEEVLCVNLKDKTHIRHSQEAYGDRNYYACPVYWSEIYTYTGEETPGRIFTPDDIDPQHERILRSELYAFTKDRSLSCHGVIVGRMIISDYYSIGD